MNNYAAPTESSFHERLSEFSEDIRSLKTQADLKRSRADKMADRLTSLSGSMPFLLLNFIWFAIWIVINIGLIPFIQPFDPFPFGLLTMIVSLEAIMLAIGVLISQNRAAQIADLRAEVDLQVDMITEQEITKLLQMMALLLEKNGIDITQDQNLKAMLKPTNIEKIETILEEQIIGQKPSDNEPI